MNNDSPFCLWAWEVAVSWMNPVLWILSSPFGVCVNVLHAGSREGRESPVLSSVCGTCSKGANQGREEGLGTSLQEWSEEIRAQCPPSMLPTTWCWCGCLWHEFFHALQLCAHLSSCWSSLEGDLAGAERLPWNWTSGPASSSSGETSPLPLFQCNFSPSFFKSVPKGIVRPHGTALGPLL